MITKNKKLFVILGTTALCVFAVAGVFKYFDYQESVFPKIEAIPVNISAAVLPHHDLAKSERIALLQGLANKVHPKTIILVSPNHFDTGKSYFITTDKTWKLSNSIINPAKKEIDALVAGGGVSSDANAFDREHGISNILDDLYTTFPDANLLPVIIKQSAPEESVAKLSKNLLTACPKDCLLLASVDFSHYQPGALATIHDSLSVRALADVDENLIYQAEVDSPQALALAISWAKAQNTERFTLQKETNSGEISGEPDAESTSYVSGWFEKGEKTSLEEMTFQIGGDMMFDRMISYRYPQNNLVNVMKNLGDRFFWGTDASIVNLEGPIAESYAKPNIAVNNLSFRFPPKTVDVLKYLHLDGASLANNHTLNGGTAMLANTKAVLLNAGIAAIGDQTHVGEQTFNYQKNNITVITINTLEDGTNLESRIKAAKATGNFVLVFPHWGSEYSQTHSRSQEVLARAWIDAGADLVIGSHPHVVQDAQVYKGKPIFYSLGNLVFDQTFSAETQRGLVIAGKISADKLTLVLLPVISKNLQPELLRGEDRFNLISKFREELGAEKVGNSYGFDIIELSR